MYFMSGSLADDDELSGALEGVESGLVDGVEPWLLRVMGDALI
jgi:hypothetical protein